MKTYDLDARKDVIFCAIYDGKVFVVEKYNTFMPRLRAVVINPFRLKQMLGRASDIKGSE